MSLNKIMLLGRLGKDPELKYTPSGAAVCTFSVATSETWMDKSGQKQEKTEWHRVVVWGKRAETCNQYLAKGRQVFIEGKLQTRSWDGTDGQKKFMTEINALSVQFIGGAAGTQKTTPTTDDGIEFANAMEQDYSVSTDANFTSDDIPF